MRKLTYLAAFAMAATAALSACKKDKDNTPAVDRATALTANSWDVTEYKLFTGSGGFGITENYLTGEAACDADDVLKFTADHKLFGLEGATKCSTTDSDTTGKGTYTLKASNDSLIVSGGSGFDGKYKINDFSTSGFTLVENAGSGGIDEITTIKVVKK